MRPDLGSLFRLDGCQRFVLPTDPPPPPQIALARRTRPSRPRSLARTVPRSRPVVRWLFVLVSRRYAGSCLFCLLFAYYDFCARLTSFFVCSASPRPPSRAPPETSTPNGPMICTKAAETRARTTTPKTALVRHRARWPAASHGRASHQRVSRVSRARAAVVEEMAHPHSLWQQQPAAASSAARLRWPTR